MTSSNYNLLEEKWIPVRRQSGRRDWIAPHQIAEIENPALRLDSLRPDFNGALIQFLIGLMQTVAAPETEKQWRKLFAQPPSPDELQRAFLTHRKAFNLFGEGPRFMQELAFPVDEASELPIEQMLIGSPGENTVKNNADHFVKRGGVRKLGVRQVPAALLSLQLNAPSGGQGHLTSLRGGGPLTTVLLGKALWDTVLLNVLPAQVLHEKCGGDANAQPFSWCAPARLSARGEVISPSLANAAVCFWATPRRLWLSEPSDAACDVEGAVEPCVGGYRTLSHGNKYGEGFLHPLTPYSRPAKAEFPLSVKGKPLGLPYVEWPALVAPVQGRRPALVVEHALAERRVRSLIQKEVPRVWVFGFDMDNAKARGWHETRTPLHTPADNTELSPSERLARHGRFGAVLGGWVEGAREAQKLTISQVAEALVHPQRDRLKSDFWTGVTLDFWRDSEAAFFFQINLLTEAVGHAELERELGAAWLEALRSSAFRIFDRYVPTSAGALERVPDRVARAHHKLRQVLHGKKIHEMVGVPHGGPKGGSR